MTQNPTSHENDPPEPAGPPSLPIVPGAITIDPSDPEVILILSQMCFTLSPIADVFQKAGYPIPTHTEEEQAHILLWMLALHQKHGADWRSKGDEELQALHQKANRS